MAYFGDPVPVEDLLSRPEHSIIDGLATRVPGMPWRVAAGPGHDAGCDDSADRGRWSRRRAVVTTRVCMPGMIAKARTPRTKVRTSAGTGKG
jgi:hypothetical protein